MHADFNTIHPTNSLLIDICGKLLRRPKRLKHISNHLHMNKPLIVGALILIPALLIVAGFYYGSEILSSIGFVILIFYIVMAIRGKFSDGKKDK